MVKTICQQLSPEQHGFMPARSTTTNLVQFVQIAYDVVDRGGQLDVVYIY